MDTNLMKHSLDEFDEKIKELYSSTLDIGDACGEVTRKISAFLKKSEKKKGKLIEKAKEAESISESITEVSSSLSSLLSEITKIPSIDTTAAGQIIYREIEIYSLELKKSVLELQLKASDRIAKTSEKLSRKKEDIDTKKISTFVDPILLSISGAISIAISSIESVLAMIPKNLKINAMGMSMFMTPKNPNCEDITPTDAGFNIQCKLPEPVKQEISKISESVNEANAKTKAAVAEAASANGEITLFEGLSESIAASAPIINAENIENSIENLIDLTITQEALPKYEKTNPLNPSFLLYLNTVFSPALSKSFGMPGY